MKIGGSKRKRVARFLSLLVILSFIFSFHSMAYAETTKNSAAVTESAEKSQGPKDAKKIETFADQFFTESLKKNNVPGVAIVGVRDGKVILKKGYGYANVEKKMPVDPDKTVFRNGSVGSLSPTA